MKISRMKKEKPFKLEAELCAAFISALPTGWIAYPETAGWDILLVRDDGVQIGIQAKLKLNVTVVTQALEDYGGWGSAEPGPDYRAVLVPPGEGGLQTICAYIGLTIITVVSGRYWSGDEPASEESKYRISPGLPRQDGSTRYGNHGHWYEWLPSKRHRLPEYVPDVAAGVASPTQLTQWKIKAIKISIVLERRGYLVRSDFKHIGLDNRRWMPSGGQWLTIDKDAGVYRKGPHYPDFKQQHPKNWAEIEADYERWAPAPPLLPALEPKLPLEAVAP